MKSKYLIICLFIPFIGIAQFTNFAEAEVLIEHSPFPIPFGGSAVPLDYNQDNIIDFVLSRSEFSASVPRVELFTGLSNGSFSIDTLYDDWPYILLESIDIDGDADLDLVVDELIFYNDENAFESEFPLKNSENTITELGDYNADGRLDFIAYKNSGFTTGVWLYMQQENDVFENKLITDVEAEMIKSGDVDLDGDLDFFAFPENAGSQILLFRNDGTGKFIEETISLGLTVASNIIDLQDLDLDGDLDLILHSFNLVIYENQDGNFNSSNRMITDLKEGEVAKFGNINDDQYLDIVFAGLTQTEYIVDVALGNGDLSFTPSERVFSTDRGGSISFPSVRERLDQHLHLLDLNDDGLDDIICTVGFVDETNVLQFINNTNPDAIIDLDGDGYLNDEDCNDYNDEINPDAIEIVGNEIDEDCDGIIVPLEDADMDGFLNDIDCDDTNPDIYPGAEEITNNNIDEDCDGEDLLSLGYCFKEDLSGIYDCKSTAISKNAGNEWDPCDGNMWSGIVRFDRRSDAPLSYDIYSTDAQLSEEYNDMSFGMYYDCYDVDSDDSLPNGSNGSSGSLNFNVECDQLSIPGLSQFNELYSARVISVSLDTFRFIWENDYPESALVELIRTDGTYWLDIDDDQDGFTLEEDCNDNDPLINPDAIEIVGNGIDENCDGLDFPSSSEDISNQSLKVFPNPVLDQFTIDHDFGIKQISVIDQLGKVLLTFNEEMDTYDISSLITGIYILEITNENDRFEYLKIVKR